MQKGDTIVGFKGRPVATIDDLHKQLVASEIGVPSPIMVLRGTEKLFRLLVPRESQTNTLTAKHTKRR